MKLRHTLLFAIFCFAIPQAKAQQGPPSATLTWDAVTVPTPGALTYKIERANLLAGPYTQIGNPSATTFTDTSVTRGSTYFYRLKSSCPTSGAGCGTTAAPVTGDSAATSSTSATIPNAATAPAVPQNLTISTQ